MASLRLKDCKGFTLIELLLVVAILGILASIAIAQYQDVMASARGARILDDLKAIDSAINIARARGINVSDGDISTVLPAELIPEYLASGPKPATGTAIINGGSAFSVPSGTIYSITSQRATINSKTVEQVLTDKRI